MSRALIPCGALAGVSWVSWTWLRQEVPRIALQGLIQLATPRLPVEFEALVPERPVLETIWTVGGAFILWHSWREVVWVFKAILGVIYWLVCFIGSTLEGVTRWWQQCFRAQRLIESHTTNLRAAEQEVFFTWRQMAVVAGGPPLPLGTFVLVSRPPGWDEVLVFALGECAGGWLPAGPGWGGWESGQLGLCSPSWATSMEANPCRDSQFDHRGQSHSGSVSRFPGWLCDQSSWSWWRPAIYGDATTWPYWTRRSRRRRGFGRGSARGARAGIGRKWRQSESLHSELEGFRIGSAAVAGFGPQSSQFHEEPRQIKEEKERQEEEKAQEEKEIRFLKLIDLIEPIPQSKFQQSFIRGEEEAPSVETGRKGQASSTGKFDTCRPIEAEEAWGSSGICSSSSRCIDSTFPGKCLQPSFQRGPDKIWTTSRGVSNVMGPAVFRVDGGERHEGSHNTGRDSGCSESKGDCSGIGCAVPKDPCHSGGEDQRWDLGEGGVHRACGQSKVLGQQQYAGFDESVKRRFRRFWFALGGATAGKAGFNDFYRLVGRVLVRTLNSRWLGLDLASEVHRLFSILARPSCMAEFKTGKSSKRGLPMGSPAHVFPLPPMSYKGRILSLDACGEDVFLQCLYYNGNMIVAVLNWLHGGRWDNHEGILSAAHCRVHGNIAGILEAQVMTDEPLLSFDEVDKYLRHSQLYSGSGVVLALGVRGGVPHKAADVQLADHLEHLFPEMSRQIRQPSLLLLKSRDRPKRVKRGYTWLAPSYSELVRKNVKAGLHKLKHPHQVAKHRGRPVVAGAFAVVKDDVEDRVITDPQVNQLLDPDALPRPKFAFIPSLRGVTVPKHGMVVVSKRDARHYFHRLRIGRRWGRWLCGPSISLPVRGGGKRQMFPACQSTPMGFGPSAGWAQGMTDVVAVDAELPTDRRLHPDSVVPSDLPIWGSIIDDIWALDHKDTSDSEIVGPQWLQRAEDNWCIRGVEPNAKKSVNGAEGEEIQGFYVHPYDHWVGVSLVKRRHLFQATVVTLLRRTVVVAVVDRLIGKHSFVHAGRPCLRSIFEKTYIWITSVRDRPRALVELPDDVWIELLTSAMLLIFAQFDLSSSWSTRLECTDASMSGLGRAFGVVPEVVVRTLARFTDHQGIYTNLALPWGISLKQRHACPMRKVRVPIERIRWTKCGVPWNCEHITLGEADAACWAAEDRLRRPRDNGGRFVHGLDSAACTGAFTKGRSSSHQLNKRCRRMASINLAGGHEVFYPWMPSAENPADEPSRRYEPSTAKSERAELESIEPIVDIADLGCWPAEQLFFIHLCSGPRRKGDLLDAIESLGREHGFDIQGLAVDPLAEMQSTFAERSTFGATGDLLNPLCGSWLLQFIHNKRVVGGFGSPPYSTISTARHKPLNISNRKSPRPLRSRTNPWVPLAYCNIKEVMSVQIGSALFLICLGLLGEIALRGGWTGLEHPADRGREPYPSFFNTEEVKEFMRIFGLGYQVLDQCMFGALSRKPTGLLLPRSGLQIGVTCNHVESHPLSLGLDSNGLFRTTPAAKYPHGLCQAVGQCFIQRLALAHEKHFTMPQRVHSQLGSFSDPWHSRAHVSWEWPEPCSGFLASLIEAINCSEVHSSTRGPQQ